MGLFWSMKPVLGISKDPLLRKRDVTTPLIFRLSVIEGHIPVDDMQLATPVVLATDELERWYKHSTVRRTVLRDGLLRGTLFLPEGEGPFPGIIDMFGSTGGLTEFRAALLASRGFASYALPFFGYDDLPPSLADFDFDYVLGAVDWFACHQSVQHGGIGVVGTSKGGELALLLGMATNKVKALVNITGPPFYSFTDLKKSGQVYWKGVKAPEGNLTQTDEGIYLRDIDASYGDIIPAWKNNARILYLCGDDDGVLMDTYANTFMEACPEEEQKNIELIIYPGAGHLIEPPYMPLCRTIYHNMLGMTLVMGGQTEGHAVAQEDAWKRLLEFFHKHL
ncbi:acyl-coenzyme A thioesterase 1-like [Haliotis asinina]|uniref:acyl-coenzyme A thioesterase 1-like n=1 Tax=Haliotis asinina TaxID=109174 RepID=UPI0035324B76